MRSNPRRVSVLLLVIVNMLLIIIIIINNIIIIGKMVQKYIFCRVNFALSRQSNYIRGDISPRM
jgi:hypothetical protein